MAPRLYLETSMISYLVVRPIVSELVIREAEIGDLARERLAIIEPLTVLSVPEEAEQLAPLLLRAAGLAANAATDALHIALAAVHGMHYLVTWNCAHIANAAIRRAVEHHCRLAGYEPPVICTPQELVER